jgi:DNA ligase (NAD+)
MDHLSEQKLVELIEHHNKLYWEQGAPEIADTEYDLLIRQLQTINPNHPLITAVYAPAVATQGKVKHETPMLSLNKAYSLEELLTWANKFARNSDEEFLIQPKYDGISANFANNVLATRGDGVEGENITDKLTLIELEAIGYTGPLNRPSRGEIIIRNDDFKEKYSKIARKDGRFYKNSRNAVAGIMGLKEIDHMIKQKAKLTLVDYNLVSFTIKLANFAEEWTEILKEIEDLPYPMDGIVVKFADKVFAESLGSTAHHPRGQIAFKFTGVRKQAKLLDVDWSFGKNCLTPVALLEPVEIGGITIQHATLHNIQNIIDRDIEIGDTVTVERAGDVIPYIVDAERGKERRSCMITNCPSCNSILVREGPEICCQNNNCPETKVQRLLASVRNIGIERLGEPNVRRMMDTLGVNSLKDIFNLTLTDILKLEGFKEKSAKNLVGEIDTARHVNDFQVLAALNIRAIGKNVAKTILGNYDLSELRKLEVEQLSEINGVGPERAEALFCELRKQADFLDELLECVTITNTKDNDSPALPTICFTGKMPEPRSYYENMASDRGYQPVDSVTKELSILVANDISSGSSKLAKAAKQGVQLMQLDDWLKVQEVQAPARGAQAPERQDIQEAQAPIMEGRARRDREEVPIRGDKAPAELFPPPEISPEEVTDSEESEQMTFGF